MPVAIELAGESLVLFRDRTGAIAALLDRCPHRGAALSLGTVTESGCLECPYHGWQFASDGACTRVPLNALNDNQRSQLSAVCFPTKIIAGLVWVFTGTEDVPELHLPLSLLEDSDRYVIVHEAWNAHWTRAVENSLDYPHVPFVHQNSFGRELNAVAQTDVIAQVNVKAIPNGMTVRNRLNTFPSGIEFDWHQPNCVVIKFDLVGMPVRSHLFAIPINARQTRFMQVILPYLGMDQTSFDIVQFTAPVAEDRIVIESQIGEVPNTTDECNVPTDEPSLRFRRWYYRVVKRQLPSEVTVIEDVARLSR
ncbi:MAG: aromatic ring-hydroxylating dioxygenase subunit alpha [Leptolyngbya sp. Prado105]|jgi:phenylpropionate dioxygenase-like ring-hydroxylating dioxygenase large terminal subunit|nr:aromatic ring-hydroxylating dioxygenase subunit alpha [Leptolyngbya sp. Prado105]